MRQALWVWFKWPEVVYCREDTSRFDPLLSVEGDAPSVGMVARELGSTTQAKRANLTSRRDHGPSSRMHGDVLVRFNGGSAE